MTPSVATRTSYTLHFGVTSLITEVARSIGRVIQNKIISTLNSSKLNKKAARKNPRESFNINYLYVSVSEHPTRVSQLAIRSAYGTAGSPPSH